MLDKNDYSAIRGYLENIITLVANDSVAVVEGIEGGKAGYLKRIITLQNKVSEKIKEIESAEKREEIQKQIMRSI